MNRSFRVRNAIRNQHLTGATIEGAADLLMTFVRPARYEHKIVCRASPFEWLGWSYDETDDLIIPEQSVYEWLISPATGLVGSWSTCLAARSLHVKPEYCEAFDTPIFDLVISFEHEDDAMLFRLKWTGARS